MKKKKNLNNELSFLFCQITFKLYSELDIIIKIHQSFNAYIFNNKIIVLFFL